jgi:lipoprotein-anchoring transpeptidase ErfK/SrfK
LTGFTGLTGSPYIHFRVELAKQRVLVLEQDRVVWEAPVSTAAAGGGEIEGSCRTPRGWHVVVEKIGEGAPWGAVFRSRQPTGEIWSPNMSSTDQDLILTRILWLAGAEAHNANTQQRYIYFHGTNHEDTIGQPTSHGCIRLRNDDIVKLFDYAAVGTRVEIVE